jgi:hypothetical protein
MPAMKYENACEFYNKADWEGGLAELVLGYGVSASDVPLPVAVAATELERAFKKLNQALDEWHGTECVNPDELCAR